MAITERVQLADVLVSRVKQVVDTDRPDGTHVTLVSAPPIGSLTLQPPLGQVVDDVVAALLENVKKHGATELRLDFELDRERDGFSLDIIDNGPGLDPAVMDNSTTRLYSLREAARNLNGDLTLQPMSSTGTTLRLFLPFPRRSRR